MSRLAGEFDSIKIGVCDIFWTPAPTSSNLNPVEVFLGLTKGGVELTYTPEYKDLTVDQYGKAPVDSVLIGETIVTKAPLAETSLDKIKMFAHTGVWVAGSKKVTFGSYPGLRLGDFAGKLRLHPIANGIDTSEDVTIYKAVNKGALQLNYKLEDETIFACEFHGMIKRGNNSGAFLWEIGESMSTVTPLLADLSNLETLLKLVNGEFQIVPTTSIMLYGTADLTTTPVHAVSSGLTITCDYNSITRNINSLVTYGQLDALCNGYSVVSAASGGTPVAVINVDPITGVITASPTATLITLYKNGVNLVVGDVVTTSVSVQYAGKEHIIYVQVTV